MKEQKWREFVLNGNNYNQATLTVSLTSYISLF